PAASQSLCVSARPVGETSHIATLQASATSWRTSSRPIPLPPPVTTAVLPANSVMCAPPVLGTRWSDLFYRRAIRSRSPRAPVRGRSKRLGPVAVGMRDYLHQVAIGVIEIDAATPVQMIDLAELGAPRIGVIPDALSADPGERSVELGVADEEGVMPRP